MRTATVERNTNETSIKVEVNLDGNGEYNIDTGVGFLDHMLEQLSRHSLIDLNVKATGDIHIDFHHLAEDVGITVGQTIKEALGDKVGITRYGSALIPMDEVLIQCALDISGRPYLVWNVEFKRDKVGDMDTELFREWFYAFANALGANLHISKEYGENDHHTAEACYKALARSLRQATEIDERKADSVPSTKGVL